MRIFWLYTMFAEIMLNLSYTDIILIKKLIDSTLHYLNIDRIVNILVIVWRTHLSSGDCRHLSSSRFLVAVTSWSFYITKTSWHTLGFSFAITSRLTLSVVILHVSQFFSGTCLHGMISSVGIIRPSNCFRISYILDVEEVRFLSDLFRNKLPVFVEVFEPGPALGLRFSRIRTFSPHSCSFLALRWSPQTKVSGSEYFLHWPLWLLRVCRLKYKTFKCEATSKEYSIVIFCFDAYAYLKALFSVCWLLSDFLTCVRVLTTR